MEAYWKVRSLQQWSTHSSQYAKKGFHKAFRDEEKQSDVYWLAWEVTRRSGETVKPFGMDFIETLKSVEVLDSDPLA